MNLIEIMRAMTDKLFLAAKELTQSPQELDAPSSPLQTDSPLAYAEYFHFVPIHLIFSPSFLPPSIQFLNGANFETKLYRAKQTVHAKTHNVFQENVSFSQHNRALYSSHYSSSHII